MESGPVVVERAGDIVLATIDHPPANAISRAVIRGLSRALSLVGGDGGGRTLLITGSGTRFFSAGADLNEVASEGRELRAEGLALVDAIERCPVPVIAAVNGMAFGGGCEIALAADLRIASTAARFGQPEVNLGLIPGWGATQRLPRLVGRSAALALLLTGEPIDAQYALQIGLVSEVVRPSSLTSLARELAEKLASRAPLAVAAIKRALHQGLDRPLEEGLAVEARELTDVIATSDAVEGVMAFLEKRTPRWTGT